MATREQNEKEFRHWEDLPDGRRRYSRDRKGKISGTQRMVKIVDDQEVTLMVIQEIYDDNGLLIERHQKFPEDTGHEIFGQDES